jgi:two-component system chemotaxis response regulator CheB
MASHNIIVIGASAGGIDAMTKLVRTLPKNIPAALFVVLHIPPDSPSLLPEILSRAGSLPALHPADKTAIIPGHIYVAPPDHHLMIERGYVHAIRGPKENRHRPAVDPLFRSAASAYRQCVVGVILSGGLDDGTAGLLAIKRCGGVSMVQSPQEALYPQMPQSALDNVQIDYCLPVEKMGETLNRLASETVEEELGSDIPVKLKGEAKIAQHMNSNLSNEDDLAGDPSIYSCPECGGVLWEIGDGKLLRFRCRIGHALSAESVLVEQSEALDKALWVALRTLEEKVNLLRRLAGQMHGQGKGWLAQSFESRTVEAEEHANLLRNLLTEAGFDRITSKAAAKRINRLVGNVAENFESGSRE